MIIGIYNSTEHIVFRRKGELLELVELSTGKQKLVPASEVQTKGKKVLETFGLSSAEPLSKNWLEQDRLRRERETPLNISKPKTTTKTTTKTPTTRSSKTLKPCPPQLHEQLSSFPLDFAQAQAKKLGFSFP